MPNSRLDSDRKTAAPYPAPTDMRPELLATLKVDTKGCDIWECRTCPKNAVYVLVVPIDSAWGHAVDPRCEDCYPADLPRLCSHGWPGPTTPNRAKRRHMAEAAKEAEVARLRAAIEEYLLWEPGRRGHAAAHGRLREALNGGAQVAVGCTCPWDDDGNPVGGHRPGCAVNGGER